MPFNHKRLVVALLSSVCPVLLSAPVWAQPDSTAGVEDSAGVKDSAAVEEIQVMGRRVNLVGQASSASEGIVSQEEISMRPLLRTGEVLETVPGVVATQHSGPGKANQYFLRGFNLDHGNDFATFIDAMPINMRTHGHGQGYTDLNFIIPELIGQIAYQKGSYYPGTGDFSGTGSARMSMTDSLSDHSIKLGTDFGRENWNRVLASGEFETGSNGGLIYGLELEGSDGHWDDIETDLKRRNLWLKQQWQSGANEYGLTFMGYDNSWNSADQIPQRAVDAGIITEHGSINTTSGGNSSRYSLSGDWQHASEAGILKASAYAVDYDLNLWADFTYFIDPAGDQHHQVDKRQIYGWDISWAQDGQWGDWQVSNTFGNQLRYDDIAKVGIYQTQARARTGVFRIDAVDEWSNGSYWENELRWTENFRTTAGLRYDYFSFKVDPKEADFVPSLLVNGGKADADIITASVGAIYTFSPEIEIYGNIGQGFHSNDARGATIALDPVTGDPQELADPLVDTLGYEFGVRAFLNDSLNLSMALWSLDIDSELVFVGDTGTTEDTGVGSKRKGLELTAYYYLNDVWTLDFEYSWSDARFEEKVDGSDLIPGALEHVFSGGVNARFSDRFYSNFRVRHFEDYPLDGGRTAEASTIANLRLAWEFTDKLEVSLDILNLFDSADRDIQYVYESRLQSEFQAGLDPVEDVHFHIFEPRSYHVNFSYRF